MFVRRLSFALGMISIYTALSCDAYAGPQDAASDTKVSEPVIAPPAPGPELLKFTPEEIEAAYEGKRMPEAVSMYLVIARGGQLDGTSGWFGPAASRFSGNGSRSRMA